MTLLPGLLIIPGASATENAIARLNYAGLKRKGHCTATLITKNMALTARHCVIKRPLGDLHLVFGYDRGNWAEHRRIRKVYQHKSRDIALLCLDKPAKQKPIALAGDYQTPSDHLLTIVGYKRSRPHLQTTETCAYRRGKTRARIECLFEPGMSGSPVMVSTGNQRAIIGVVSGNTSSFSIAALIGDMPKADCSN